MAVARPTWNVLAGVVAVAPAAIASAATLDIATVRVGNAGNGADARTGLGAVPYEYYIGTTEVTNGQYAAFLNAVDPSGVNPHDLYNPNMTNATGFAVVKGGIDFLPAAAMGSKYAPKPNYGNKPVNYVSFYDAARFANWLMTGETERGFYVFSDARTLVSQGVHGPETLDGLNWVAITSHDEWYKAAFHRNDGLGGNYYLYPTAGDETPVIARATLVGDIANPGPNVANYAFGANWDGTGALGHVTTVGSAGPESASPYGTFDQGGNVIEWVDEVTDMYRVTRGGSLWLEADKLKSDYSSFYNPNAQGSSLGFRISSLQPVSSVPVPPPLALMTVGLLSLYMRRKRMPASLAVA